MNERIIDEYISGGGQFCPFCGKEEITSGEMDVDSDFAWLQVHCPDCKKSWTEIFRLITIEEIED